MPLEDSRTRTFRWPSWSGDRRAPLAVVIGSALLTVITWIDYVTGYELELFVFYFAPIAMCAWYAGRLIGLGAALVAAMCWYWSDHLSGHVYSRVLLDYWDAGVRLASFVTIALVVSSVRDGKRRQESVLHLVSHDMRAPLGVIFTAADLLKRNGDAAHAADAADRVRRAAVRMNRMIEDVLDSARASHGRLTLALENLGLVEWLPLALDELRDTLDLDRVDLRLPAEPVRPVRADPVRLVRVLGNLLSNALKYSRPDTKVRLSVEVIGRDWTSIAVSDCGRGLSEQDRRRLFRPFQRGAAAGPGGIGLGLISTAALVKAHRGRLRVVSRPGAGTTVVVELPSV